MPPKVSICLPIYNGTNYMAQAIDSALKQTFTDFEVLIANDRSEDGTLELIQDYARRDNRVKYWTNERKLGLFENYNECMRRAAGQFIKLFAHDDIFEPVILERMVNLLEEKPSVSLVSVAKCWIDATGEKIEATSQSSLKTMRPFSQDTYLTAKEAICKTLQKNANWLGEPCAVMFRRTQMGTGFDTKFLQIGDLEYSYRLLEHGDFYYIDEPLCLFRKHEESITQKNSRSLLALLDWFLLASKHRRYLDELGESEDTYCERLTRRLLLGMANEVDFGNEDWRSILDSMFTAFTGSTNMLSFFEGEHGAERNAKLEYKAMAVSAILGAAELTHERTLAQNQLDYQRDVIANLRKEIEDSRSTLQAEVSELRQAYSKMGNSLSWKVTAPLRRLRGSSHMSEDRK
jgi:glycosyltransferase involved in cell wall biosynthesis